MANSTEHKVQHCDLGNFRFQDGTTLTSTRLAYLDLNPDSPKTALIITCFRGRLESTLNFSDGVLKDYRTIVVALFGNGESSSPSNVKGFPKTTDYRDCVRAQRELLTRHLHVQTLDVIMGFSMGGQCTYYWTLMHPDFVQNAVIICSSARTSRHNYQFLEGPKAALENSIDFESGYSSADRRPIRGLRAFGKAYSAWLTSAEWFDQEMYKSLGYETLNDWDKAVAGRNYYNWNPDDLLTKLHMWQKGDITVINGSSGETLEAALSRIKARILLMPCQTDQYFRWEASERESRCIKSVTLKVIPSIWGHLAGAGSNWADIEWMDQTIAQFLAETEAAQV